MNILFIAPYRIGTNEAGVQRDKGFGVGYLSCTKGTDEKINGIDQHYLPNGKSYNDLSNIIYFKKLLKKKKINIVINQIGFRSEELRFIRKNISYGIKIITVHHNCVKCLNDQYQNIYAPTLKSKGLFTFFNNIIGWYLLKSIHKLRFRYAIKNAIKLSDKVVLLSEKFITEIAFYLPKFEVAKVIAIPNPNPFSNIDVNLAEKQNIILYVGRLVYTQKRVDLLVELWRKLHKDYPNWSFDIVGDGHMKEDLEKASKKLKLERINFFGRKDPTTYYERSKIFCLTSDFEGFGMVLVEAQSYGVVPISFKSFSSIDEIIDDGNSGIIIDDYDFENYINELKLLMNDQDKIKAMSLNAENYVKKFDSKLIAEGWIKMIKSL